ncbi:MAG: hypothetical protein N4A33_12075 [Bacteriovoracaceae bacterium]|jgi:hypothetical protein|nr:hypothetical protein [Bacteriovoracaceae bacterium]
MKKLLFGLLAIVSISTFASDLKPSEIKIGSLATYYDGWQLDRTVGKIVAVYSNGKVRISHGGLSRVKNISNIGIQIDSTCLDGLCVGDKVSYYHVGRFENIDTTISVIFDNNTARLGNKDVRKLENLSTAY